ncbi:5-methylcytosine restriction system specificity protein McrC [Clostridium algidicarnis]|uniref:5-methylcytosine restriction system specificity protein McrC n=1 Tax=Clostridium algidicarnis TaxID=37659 RepID=UPI003FD775C1
MNEIDNTIIEYELSDFSPIKDMLITRNGQPFIDVEYRILKAACKMADSAMEKSNENESLVVNINSRSRGEKKELINWESEYVCGFVGAVRINKVKISGDDTEYTVKITIKSRFDKDKPYFLSYMLSQTELDFHDWDVPMSYDDLFDFLMVALFAFNLKAATMQGLFRTYQRFERNDEKIKGSIDIARNIRLNLGLHNGKIAYSYRENTCDNNLNHLILYAYEHLKACFSEQARNVIMLDNDYKKILSSIYANAPSFPSTNKNQVISKALRPIAHPYYQRYEILRRISLLILQNKGISIFGSVDQQVQGILYYVPDLWEKCLENKLKEENVDYYLTSQTEVKVLENNTYPDFIFYGKSDQKPFFILDAKFKQNWYHVASTGKLTGSRTNAHSAYNYWEDYNKCIRDMDSNNANEVGVIFPCGKKQESIRWVYERSKYNNHKFYCYAVLVPESKNSGYTEWKKAFATQFGVTIKGINNDLKQILKKL